MHSVFMGRILLLPKLLSLDTRYYFHIRFLGISAYSSLDLGISLGGIIGFSHFLSHCTTGSILALVCLRLARGYQDSIYIISVICVTLLTLFVLLATRFGHNILNVLFCIGWPLQF